METWTRTTETCPGCGHAAVVDWSGLTVTFQRGTRLRLHATAFACSHHGCRLDPDQLHVNFPDRLEH